MPASTEARSGLFYGWDVGENFAAEMDDNIKHIGKVGLHLSVLDRDLTVAPGAPSDGDTYIIGVGATGIWAGKDNQVAVYDTDVPGWRYTTPRTGWVCFIEDEVKLCAFYSGAWSAGISI